MPGVDEIVNKLKGFLFKPASPSGARPVKNSQQSSVPKMQGAPGGTKPGFDFNMYIKAVQLFGQDFFGKKVPYFFQNIGPVMKGAPIWWGGLQQDEQISYGVLGLGSIMFIAGIVLVIVL